MKENLNREDVREWYLTECGLIKAVHVLNNDVTKHLGKDTEFNEWFLTMYDVFTESFVNFVFSKTKHLTEKRKTLVERFHEFIEKKKVDKQKEEEYRESRPDLYD